VPGRDRPGLLHDLARSIAEMGLSLETARIDGYGERAVDVFYVRDLFGHKITHPDRLKAIEAKLLRTLGDGDIASEAAA